MSHLDHVYAVILAGGGGTRLWPKSKIKTPKQFLKILGEKTMIQVTVDRISGLIPWERIIIVTNELYKDEVYQQLPNVPKENIISEPQKRDTALAMLTGALYAKTKDQDAVIVNLASDHVVANQNEFVRVMTFASKIASENDFLVTVGISPIRPSTGFGYIRIANVIDQIAQNLDLYKVESFTEKPNEEKAKEFISTGKYYWNANMYVWSTSSLEKSFKKYMPEMYDLTKDLSKSNPSEFQNHLKAVYDQAEAISIDYAISEKADNLVLIPGNFGWDDVGDWKVVYDLENKNQDGNVIIGDQKDKNVITIDSKNNLIHTNGRLISTVGIENMIIIDTPEALMIMPKSRSQDVKLIVEKLKQEKKEEYL
ncbi:mannose-1-phosphate guanylyltransferase [Candidatus Woesebacteria bacterium]|nr:mannose-1-phosphate guanylyltransferase [Candidatus Woesebacteria bacterium]